MGTLSALLGYCDHVHDLVQEFRARHLTKSAEAKSQVSGTMLCIRETYLHVDHLQFLISVVGVIVVDFFHSAQGEKKCRRELYWPFHCEASRKWTC